MASIGLDSTENLAGVGKPKHLSDLSAILYEAGYTGCLVLPQMNMHLVLDFAGFGSVEKVRLLSLA